MINRPDVVYDDKRHTYTLDGKKLAGVSSVAKVGEDDTWGVASAWAFRIGYEGAHDILLPDPKVGGRYPDVTKDELRELLKRARKTPWHKTKESQDRGTAIHDALEHLAQKGEVPTLESFPLEQRGYVQGLCRWFLDFRPEFVATEVQVVSAKHGFAGRYDIRATLPPTLAREHLEAGWESTNLSKLVLIDLKTGKKIYPTSQFVQLAGYELASVEMGYPSTDAQFVLNVHSDGSYDFARSCATMEHFLAYLATFKAIRDIKEKTKNA